ncbi:hypothetical protein FNU76_15870 [Chitinimonas arctica]|uniref:Uncharacterized protein n=1 Tax=Chitinimonas arctica TaxID=2594795 RepID=A0A516SI44_9NEIS|nr:hypothetical protein [Chitinimonas arctica]QDQ27708.1 hypothetical protein FNU76_15870 [Chitinimonas arctica]
MKKIAENAATHEDFKKLLDEQKELMRATEEIKADVSRNSWVEQQRWQLKERYYSIVLNNLGRFVGGARNIERRISAYGMNDEQAKHLGEPLKKMADAATAIGEITGVAGVFLTKESMQALAKLTDKFSKITDTSAFTAEAWKECETDALEIFKAVRLEAARELGISNSQGQAQDDMMQ